MSILLLFIIQVKSKDKIVTIAKKKNLPFHFFRFKISEVVNLCKRTPVFLNNLDLNNNFGLDTHELISVKEVLSIFWWFGLFMWKFNASVHCVSLQRTSAHSKLFIVCLFSYFSLL